MYLISVYFDDTTNKVLQRYIERIAAETGNTFMTDNHVPPHMTISQIEARNADMLVPYMETLREKLKVGEINIVSIGMLLPYVLYAAPVLNEYLQGISEQIYETFSGINETDISRYYKPMSWLPHITLGKKLSKEQMLKTIEIMQERFSPITAKVVEIGLAKVNPHEDVVRFKLIK